MTKDLEQKLIERIDELVADKVRIIYCSENMYFIYKKLIKAIAYEDFRREMPRINEYLKYFDEEWFKLK